MQSKHITITELNKSFTVVKTTVEEFEKNANITGRKALRFSLLTEEGLRLVDSIVLANDPIEIWFEGNGRFAYIHIKVKTKLDANQKEELVSISSSGSNSANKSFVEGFKDILSGHKKATWSLAEYEADLMKKRAKDKYAEESWENLERSVLANLADDILVSAKNNEVNILISKNFSKSLDVVGSKRAAITTDYIMLTPNEEELAKAYGKVDDCVGMLNAGKKDTLHMKLIMDETIGMVKEMTGDFDALMWAERYNDECCVKVIGNTKMDADKKYDILSLAPSRKNSLVEGFTGKIRDLIETGLLNYDSVMKLNQKYNGNMVNVMGLGLYNEASAVMMPLEFAGVTWSMGEYKENVASNKDSSEEIKAAWDELERSIVASVADDIIVGVKKNKVQITIVYKLKGQ